MATSPHQRALMGFLRSLDNGSDVVVLGTALSDDLTTHDLAHDATQELQERGHAEDGVWLGCDRVGLSQAFTRGQMVDLLPVWYGGSFDRVAELLGEVPDPFEPLYDPEADAFALALMAEAHEDAGYPDVDDEDAVLIRLARWDKNPDAEARGWVEDVFARGSTKVRRAALAVTRPTTTAAFDGLLSDLKDLTKGDVADQVDALLAGLDQAGDPRLGETVEALMRQRGWAARTAAVPYLLRRPDATAEALIRKALATKQRYENSEPVVGGISTLVDLLVLRDGRDPVEVAEELSVDPGLSEGSRKRAVKEVARRKEERDAEHGQQAERPAEGVGQES